MLLTKVVLALIGSMYVGLAAWCSVQPERTSGTVGFDLRPGAGQSEFLTIYGGLELALGLAFLAPLVREEFLPYSLFLCLVVHASLVAFRTAGFVLFTDIPRTTYYFAAAEWVLLLIVAWRWWAAR